MKVEEVTDVYPIKSSIEKPTKCVRLIPPKINKEHSLDNFVKEVRRRLRE